MSIIHRHNNEPKIHNYLRVKELTITGKSNITLNELVKMKNLNKLYIEAPESMEYEDVLTLMELRVKDVWENLDVFGTILTNEDGVQHIHQWAKKADVKK